MTRSQELALAKSMREIAVRVAGMNPICNGVCVLCRRSDRSQKPHRDTCVWMLAVRTRATIAALDIETARAIGVPSAPKPVLECAWCGKPATATDESGEPACTACASEETAGNALVVK